MVRAYRHHRSMSSTANASAPLLPFACLTLSLHLHAVSSRGRIVALDAFPTHSFLILLLRLCKRRLPADHDRGKRYQHPPSRMRIHVGTSMSSGHNFSLLHLSYFGCERNAVFHNFSSSAATAGGGEPISVDLPL